MTREEAIECLNFQNEKSFGGQSEALDMAISALKEPTWQEKLEKEYLFESIKEDMTKLQAENERLFKEVEALKREWIPVSERLPEDHQNILFSTKTNRVFEGRYFKDKTEHQWYSFRDECFAYNNVVTAWQPLPEPYKAESEDIDPNDMTRMFDGVTEIPKDAFKGLSILYQKGE